MGLFGKKRTGTLKATDSTGRHFTWVLPDFGKYQAGDTLNSDNVTCHTKTKFHFHISFGTGGDIGVYIHYKNPPIPKYSYYFENSKGEVMRQHTAHTIPAETERCGHWNVCNHRDMMSFLKEDSQLTIHFTFDDDNLVMKRVPEDNLISVMWKIPNLRSKNLSPYSSSGFFVNDTLLVARLDVKRKSADAVAKWDPNDIQTFIFFLFCRKGRIPAHSIELLDASGNSYMKVEKNEDGTAQTLMVEKDVIDQHLDADGVLFVKINLFTGGNPLDALNALRGPGEAAGEAQEKDSEAELTQRQVRVGEKQEMYDVMDD